MKKFTARKTAKQNNHKNKKANGRKKVNRNKKNNRYYR